MKPATRAGIILASFGVVTLSVELGLYWLSPIYWGQPHAIKAAPVAIGCIFGFVGFYLIDHNGALEGGRFLVQSATGLLAVVRGGAKREGDVVIGKTDGPLATPPAAPDDRDKE